MSSLPGAGWYEDPSGSGGQRWWDGAAWTAHVAPAPAGPPAPPGAPALPGPASLPAGSVAPAVGAPAGFGLRVGGYLIDYIALQFVSAVVILGGFFVGAVLASLLFAVPGGRGDVVGPFVVIAGLFALIGGTIWFTIWYELHAGRPRGQTYGKQLVDVVVVDAATGLPGIGGGRAFLRILARWVSGAVFGLGYLWALWDPEQRTWHDMMTSTRVVRGPAEPSMTPVTFVRSLDVRPGEDGPIAVSPRT